MNEVQELKEQLKIQQKQIERLFEARNIEKARADKAEAAGAAMQTTLQLCLSKLRFVDWNHYQGASHWQIDDVSEEDLRWALSRSCGAGWLSPEVREKAREAMEFLWVVLCNVSSGDWSQQTAQWREAAAKARDGYHEALAVLDHETGTPEV